MDVEVTMARYAELRLLFLYGLSFTKNATVLLSFVAPCGLVLLVQESHKMFVNADAE